jgi:hypothetical protein
MPSRLFWRGLVSTDWHNAGNWSLTVAGAGGAGIPSAAVECTVSDFSNNDCYVTANAACARLRAIRIGGSAFWLNFFSADVTIGGDFLIEGEVYVQRGKGDLTIGRDFLQSDTSIFVFGSTLTGETPVTAVGRDLTVDVTTGNWIANKLAGHTITVGRSLSFNRASGLLDLTAADTWTLTVASGGGGSAVASNCDVTYSDASGGLQINATDGCTDNGNNPNWLFGGIVSVVLANGLFVFGGDVL